MHKSTIMMNMKNQKMMNLFGMKKKKNIKKKFKKN